MGRQSRRAYTFSQPSKCVRCILWEYWTERTGMNDLQSCLLVTELGKMILFCLKHYQVNCTSSISIGSSHMKLWNLWWLCLGNCSFLIGSSITHEFNSKQCYQQIQMIYILSNLISLSHTLSVSKRWIFMGFCDEKWLIPWTERLSLLQLFWCGVPSLSPASVDTFESWDQRRGMQKSISNFLNI